MIFSTIGKLSLASSSFAAVIQICLSVGIFSRALFKTYSQIKHLNVKTTTTTITAQVTKIYQFFKEFHQVGKLKGKLLLNWRSIVFRVFNWLGKRTKTLAIFSYQKDCKRQLWKTFSSLKPNEGRKPAFPSSTKLDLFYRKWTFLQRL